MQFVCGFRNAHFQIFFEANFFFYWMHIESDKKSMANTWLMDLWHIKHRKYFNRVNKRFMDKHDVYLQRIFDSKILRALFRCMWKRRRDLWLRFFWWLMRFYREHQGRRQKAKNIYFWFGSCDNTIYMDDGVNV